jgi:hypothetical protein
VLAGVSLPPAQLALVDSFADGTVRGVIHVHTSRSDGRGTPDEVAEAAARAGLAFLVFTDHGDAMQAPDPPVYRAGVLCLDGVEISTTGGHYVAIDMPAAPYPLGGEARDTVEDVSRLGGFGIAAHPDSAKENLRWQGWDAPFDAIEIINLDSSWRRWLAAPGWSPKLRLARALLAYPVRPAQTIASLIRPERVRDRLARAAGRRPIVTLAGADAHARLALTSADPGENGFGLPVPGYASSFRALSMHVRLDHPFGGNAIEDAASLVRAIRDGRLHSVVDGVAAPASFEFTASNLRGTAREGGRLAPAGPLTLHVRSNAPPGFTATVWKGTQAFAENRPEQAFSVQAADEAGAYWVEIRPPASELPWITSNAIYVGGVDTSPAAPARPAAARAEPLFTAGATAGWRIEHDDESLAAVEATTGTEGPELRFRFGLGGGTPAGQYVALVREAAGGVGTHDRLSFRARAERPMRVSVQLRGGASRWERSVFVDTVARARTVYFDDLTPIGAAGAWAPAAPIDSVLFVVDLTHARPGTSGRLWISQPALQR